MKNKKNIKILVAYHVPYKILKSDVYVPVHGGRDVAFMPSNIKTLSNKEIGWLKKNTIGDNTGDNISKLNRYINEMTVIYWAWKNQDKLGNPDYIGLNHYRRHFILNEKNTSKKSWLPNSRIFLYKSFNRKYRNMISEKYLEPMVDKYDIIASKKYCAKNMSPFFNVIKDVITSNKMSGEFAASIYDKFESIIKNKNAEYVKYFNELYNSCELYSCNMFVMRKDIYERYCEFAFPILFELLDGFNPPNTSATNQHRVIAYLAEYLTTIFIAKYKEENPERVKELDLCMLDIFGWKTKAKQVMRLFILLFNSRN